MMTAVHYIKSIIKLLLFIVLLPFLLLWGCARYRVFRLSLIKALREAGVPKSAARELARDMKIRKLFQRKP